MQGQCKKLYYLSVLMLAVASLVACGGGGSTAPGSSSQPGSTGGTLSSSGTSPGGSSSGGSGTAPSGPQIVTQPISATVQEGQTATFLVQATGTGVTYQWLINGSPVAGATGASFTTPILYSSDSGSAVSVAVADASGATAQSQAATITVTAMPLVATGTLAPGVQILAPADEAMIVSATPTQVIFSENISLSPGAIVLGQTHVFQVVSSVSTASQTAVQVAEPALESLFSSLRIRGNYAATPAVAQANNVVVPTAHRQSRATPSIKETLTGGTSFTWPFTVTDTGVALTASLTSSFSALIDYDFEANAGGLLLGRLDLEQSNTLALSGSLQADGVTQQEQLLGTVTIPISLSVVDSTLSALGVRLVAVHVPVYVGARLKASFELDDSVTISAGGALHAQYDPTNGVQFSATLTGGATPGALNPTTPGGAPSYATFDLTGSVYLRLAPALAFLDTVALLGADLSISDDNTAELQVVPVAPNYCLTDTQSVNASVNGFFKTLNASPLLTPAQTFELYTGPQQQAGACNAPVTLVAVPASSSPATFGQPIPVTVTVALDEAHEVGSPPGVPPTGTVTLTSPESSCRATLTAGSGVTATATCSIAPGTSGSAVPVSVAYSGDTHYAAGTAATHVDVASPANSLLGHQLTFSVDWPTDSTPITDSLTVTVSQGVEVSSGDLTLTTTGLYVIGTSIDIGADFVDVLYTQAAQSLPGAFNGYVITTDPSTPPIVSCSLDPQSTLTTDQVMLSCSGHQIEYSAPNVHFAVGEEVLIRLSF